MKRCAVTGSFDPITIGHMQLIDKAKKCFDQVVVLLLDNPLKVTALSRDTRLALMREATKELDNVTIDYYDGYAVDYCKSHNICAMIRGIRNEADLEYEEYIKSENAKIGDTETVYFVTQGDLAQISSTMVREQMYSGNYTNIPVKREKIIEILEGQR